MSQEYNITPIKRPKHISRAQRNRPVLVTENSASEENTLQEAPSIESEAVSAENTTVEAKPRRRLPNFFSTIGKNDDDKDKSPAEQAQARLARATRTPKSVTQSTKAISKTTAPEQTKETAKPVAKQGTTKPATAFKTKHIIGIAIYLLAANFVGLFETAFLNNIHANKNLTSFNLFGNPVVISTSTVVFLITLIVILVVLAKLDFIPRSLGPTPSARTSKTTTNNNNTEKIKTPPPVIRPGVKGSDDKLYEEYRLNQRRDKKR